MMRMIKRPPSAIPPQSGPDPDEDSTEDESTSAEQMGKAPFPASDPPAVWTWEVKAKPRGPGTDR